MYRLERIIWNREHAEFSIWSEELRDRELAMAMFGMLAAQEPVHGNDPVKEEATVLCAMGLYEKPTERAAEVQRWRAVELVFHDFSVVPAPYTCGHDTPFGVEDGTASLERVCAIFIPSWKDILWYKRTDMVVAEKARGNSGIIGRPSLFRPPEGTSGKSLVLE